MTCPETTKIRKALILVTAQARLAQGRAAEGDWPKSRRSSAAAVRDQQGVAAGASPRLPEPAGWPGQEGMVARSGRGFARASWLTWCRQKVDQYVRLPFGRGQIASADHRHGGRLRRRPVDRCLAGARPHGRCAVPGSALSETWAVRSSGCGVPGGGARGRGSEGNAERQFSKLAAGGSDVVSVRVMEGRLGQGLAPMVVPAHLV